MPTFVWPAAREFRAIVALLSRPGPPTVPASTLQALHNVRDLRLDAGLDAAFLRQTAEGLRTWQGSVRDASLVTYWDTAYPQILREIAHPPVVLFARGDLTWLVPPCVAIVGARAATEPARTWTHAIASDLARCGFVIASGMARGIDAAAHHGALAGGGATVAVLGNGLDECYPPEHVELAERIAAHGCLVSEFPPGAPPVAWHFPRRNRILAGLAAGVVVVQAEMKSGALVTARAALEENRQVMAVPGDVADPRSRGPHALLRDGAALVETAADIVAALGPAGPLLFPRPTLAPDSHRMVSPPASDPQAVLVALGAGATLEDLCVRLAWPVERLQRTLALLELADLIVRVPGGGIRPARC